MAAFISLGFTTITRGHLLLMKGGLVTSPHSLERAYPTDFSTGLTIFEMLFSITSVIIVSVAFEAVWKNSRPKLLLPWLITFPIGIILGILWIAELVYHESYPFLIAPVVSIGILPSVNHQMMPFNNITINYSDRILFLVRSVRLLSSIKDDHERRYSNSTN